MITFAVYTFRHDMHFESRLHKQMLDDEVNEAGNRANAMTTEGLDESEDGENSINNFSKLLRLLESSFGIIECFLQDIIYILDLARFLFSRFLSTIFLNEIFSAKN